MLQKPSNFYLYHRQYPNLKQLSSTKLIVDYGRLPFFNLAQQPGRPPFSVPNIDSFFFGVVLLVWPANFVSFKMTAFMFEF